jgi:hypothetical protein
MKTIVLEILKTMVKNGNRKSDAFIKFRCIKLKKGNLQRSTK